MPPLRTALMAFALLANSACTYLDMSTAAQLSALSPLEADPADFTVYLDLPEGVKVPPGAAQLGLSGTRSDTGESLQGLYALEERRLADGTLVYRIAEADLPPMRALQTRIKQWKDEVGRTASGSLSLSLDACLADRVPNPKAPITVDLAMKQGGPRLPLIKGLPLSRFLARADSGNFLPCE